MIKIIFLLVLLILFVGVVIGAYLTIKHYNRKWRWDDEKQKLELKRQTRIEMAREWQELTGEEVPTALTTDWQTERLMQLNARTRKA